MRNIITVFILFVITLNVWAQTEHDGPYRRAKIYLKDHRIIRANSLKIGPLMAHFIDSKRNMEAELPMGHISFIKIPKGTHLLEGTLFGAATLSLSALLIDLDTDPLGQPREKTAGFYLAMGGAGAAVGALIGMFIPKWKSIHLKNKSIGLHIPVDLTISPQTNALNLKISMKI